MSKFSTSVPRTSLAHGSSRSFQGNIPVTTTTDQQTLGPSGRPILRLKAESSEEPPMPCPNASTPAGPSKKKLKAEARRIAAQQQLDWLRQKFPLAFNFNFSPLALNIREAIMAVAENENRSPRALCDGIRWHTSNIRYIFNLAQPEAVRIDLKGNAVESVSEDHRVHAAERLLPAKDQITKMMKRAKLV